MFSTVMHKMLHIFFSVVVNFEKLNVNISEEHTRQQAGTGRVLTGFPSRA